MKLKVALDHNFPIPIVAALGDSIVEAELRAISKIDPRMAELADADLIHSLSLNHWQILVTCDRHILEQPRELAVILQTKMSIVVAMGQGDDHVAASGLVLAHLPHIVHHFKDDAPQVWRLRVGRQDPTDPWTDLERLAARENTTAQKLYAKHQLTKKGLRRDPLAERS